MKKYVGYYIGLDKTLNNNYNKIYVYIFICNNGTEENLIKRLKKS